jgi:hypothetical protein
MGDAPNLNSLRARTSGLLRAMEQVMQSDARDIGKWSAAPNFARAYAELAQQYYVASGDVSVRRYDTSKIPSFGDMTWPEQKSWFDTVYADAAMLMGVLEAFSPRSQGPLYNLFVSGARDSWEDKPFQIELSRCVREYTSADLTARFGNLDEESRGELQKLPCVFAYETGIGKDPKFGFIRRILRRQDEVQVDFQIKQLSPFLSADQLKDMSFELDIAKYELNRTHWAIKEVNLAKELHAKGVTLPSSVQGAKNAVDISKHSFDVALSFPGEARDLVEQIVSELERRLGPNSYFYDENYVAQLARPSLDTLLVGIYSRAKLDVVFLSGDYQKKDWCGIEFRVVRDIVKGRESERVMYIRMDDKPVDGVLSIDGYIDSRKYSPVRVAELICERLAILSTKS